MITEVECQRTSRGDTRRFSGWQRIGIVLSIVWAVPVSAQVMYKCTSPNGYIGYGFQARESFDCSAVRQRPMLSTLKQSGYWVRHLRRIIARCIRGE
jgi:hypothetical protein